MNIKLRVETGKDLQVEGEWKGYDEDDNIIAIGRFYKISTVCRFRAIISKVDVHTMDGWCYLEDLLYAWPEKA